MKLFDGINYYIVNFGLRGLILLQENVELFEAKDLKFIIYCGIISKYENINNEIINNIVVNLNNDMAEEIIQLAIDSFLSSEEIEELYIKAIGEIGISLKDFYMMSPNEVNLAYEGYLRRKETEANLTLLALKNYFTKNDKLIRLTKDKGYLAGNKKERLNTFNCLGLKEEK